MNGILGLCIAFAFIGCAFAIECYECILPCESGHSRNCTLTGYSKVTQCITLNVNGNISARCGDGATLLPNGCSSYPNSDDVRVELCACDTDLCNGAANLNSATMLATLVSGILVKILI